MAVAALALFTGACEHDDVCAPGEAQRLGDRCGTTGIYSQFPPETSLTREVFGRVHLGPALASGVVVRLGARAGLKNDSEFIADDSETTVTNDSGFYRFSNTPPIFYDLTMRNDRDVLAIRDLSVRYLDVPFGDDATPRAFTAHVDLTLDPVPSATQGIAFFVTGDDAVGASGDLAKGVDVTVRGFSNVVTLHVVVYEGSLGFATAFGHSDVRVQTNASTPLHIGLAPVTAPVQAFVVTPVRDSGVVDTGSELVMDFGLRTSSHRIALVNPKAPVSVAKVPDARYVLRTHGAKGAALSDSGIVIIDPAQPIAQPTLPDPPTLESPEDHAFLDDALVADGIGVREHVLVPSDPGAATIRVLTTDRAARLPDLVPLGLARPTGSYTWTVRHWPVIASTDGFSGADARVSFPTATSAPRVVILR